MYYHAGTILSTIYGDYPEKKNVVCLKIFDLCQSDTLLHEIALKTQEPVYGKQFKIPDTHEKEVELNFAEWLKLSIIKTSHCKLNSPIFALAKRKGQVQLSWHKSSKTAKPSHTVTSVLAGPEAPLSPPLT
jgi:hypothetical protein